MKLTFTGDNFDLEQIRETIDSPGYARLRGRYEAIVEAARNELETADTWETAMRVQARIEMLRAVLSVPKILAEEIKARNGGAAKVERGRAGHYRGQVPHVRAPQEPA